MITLKNKKILVLSPHPEDGEIGCGGLIQKALKLKATCWYVYFTDASLSTKPPYKPDEQLKELKKSTSIIGFKKDKIINFNYSVRTFFQNRQEILDNLYKLNLKLKPDLVLCHSRQDTHQDHNTITNEAIRAFKKTSILGYELPWNHFNFNADLYIKLNENQVKKKCKALSCYKSRSHRPYLKEKRLLQIMGMRGLQIEKDFAEAFEVIRLID